MMPYSHTSRRDDIDRPMRVVRQEDRPALRAVDTGDCNPPALQRAHGVAEISFKTRDARTVLDRLHQSGCMKVRRPRGEAEAVLINTAGGLTDGDRLDMSCFWRESTEATLTTQTCERIYRSRGGTASINTCLKIAAGARAAWLPQETILFDGGRLSRHTQVDLRGDGALLACEAVILGRPAMGEKVVSGGLSDFWTIRRDGRLVFVDRFGLNGDVEGLMDRRALGNGARAWASVLLCDREAASAAERLVPTLSQLDANAGCSLLGEVLLIRLLAEDGYSLRKTMTKILEAIPGSPVLPRVWSI